MLQCLCSILSKWFVESCNRVLFMARWLRYFTFAIPFWGARHLWGPIVRSCWLQILNVWTNSALPVVSFSWLKQTQSSGKCSVYVVRPLDASGWYMIDFTNTDPAPLNTGLCTNKPSSVCCTTTWPVIYESQAPSGFFPDNCRPSIFPASEAFSLTTGAVPQAKHTISRLKNKQISIGPNEFPCWISVATSLQSINLSNQRLWCCRRLLASTWS